jgi:hypothetical protein
VNSNAAEVVPAIGNIYTNDTNDDSIEIGNSPPPREMDSVHIRSRSCSSITFDAVDAAPAVQTEIGTSTASTLVDTVTCSIVHNNIIA